MTEGPNEIVGGLIIGVGNRDRGDDGVGPAVVDEIRRRGLPVRTAIREGDLADLLLDWGPDDDVSIVDCLRVDDTDRGPVGAVRVVGGDELGAAGTLSTHGMGVAECLQLADAMGRLPRRLRVLGVTGRSFGHGSISEELRLRLPDVTDEVLRLTARQPTR